MGPAAALPPAATAAEATRMVQGWCNPFRPVLPTRSSANACGPLAKKRAHTERRTAAGWPRRGLCVDTATTTVANSIPMTSRETYTDAHLRLVKWASKNVNILQDNIDQDVALARGGDMFMPNVDQYGEVSVVAAPSVA